MAEDLLEGLLDLLDDATPAQPAQVSDLVLEILRVLGQLIGEGAELPRHHPANAAQDEERHDHDQDHRRCPGEASALEQTDDWVQQKRQEDRQGHRDEHHAGPIEQHEHQEERGEANQQGELTRVVRHGRSPPE